MYRTFPKPVFHRLRMLIVLVLVLVLVGPDAVSASIPESNGTKGPAIRELIEQHIRQRDIQPLHRALDWEALQTFYRQRAYLPAWWDVFKQTREAAAFEMMAILEHSSGHGLAVTDYHLHELRPLAPGQSSSDLARFDILLTDAFLAYVSHLYSGRHDPDQVDPAWHIAADRLDAPEFLRWVLHSGNFTAAVQALAPSHAGYRRLRRLLEEYRGLAAIGGWPRIDTGRLLEVGDRDPRIAALRKRLWLEGYSLEWVSDETHFDADLGEALRQFQHRHGIEADGVVGPETLRALNVPVTERIDQILLNLERWRWLPHQLGKRYIMVNMAGFRLQLVETGDVQLDMRVIVGTPYRSTPAFADEMTYVVFNPHWNVPERIVREDLLPQQQADPEYLSSQGFRILTDWGQGAREIDPADIDWGRVEPADFPFRLRQAPGPQNSLGQLKFMLPNRFDVYLHDTPARHLFERQVRTFSSGCIRLEQPIALAKQVLQGAEEEWDENAIHAQIATGETRTVRLREAIPVYLLYWTVWVDDTGTAHFLNDIYGRDQRMVNRHQQRLSRAQAAQ